MAIGIQLQRYGMTTYVEGRTQGYRMRVVVKETVGVDDALFAYQVVPAVGGGTEYGARFSHICSPADIEEFPRDAAESGKDFFRLTEIDIIFRNLKLLEDAWEKIQSDFTELVRTLENMNNLTLAEEVTFGNFPTSSSSSSSSSS